MSRNINPGYHPKAAKRISENYSSIITEISQAIEKNDVVIVGMAQNPHIKQAKKLLEKDGIKYKYLEYGSYFSGWKSRLAIKIWSGWPTFPQIFVRGKLLGGASDLEESIAVGEFQSLINE